MRLRDFFLMSRPPLLYQEGNCSPHIHSRFEFVAPKPKEGYPAMHIGSEIALDLLEERLDADQALFWKKHLEICPDCTQEVGRWRQLEIDLERSHLKSASDQALQKAIHIYPQQPEGGDFRIRSILASVVFDTFLQPAMAGSRGSATSTRQLVMRAEEFDIHIKIWGDLEHRQMLGQLLPRGGQDFVRSARFHLLKNGERLESTTIDEMGEFHFTDLPEGDLSLQVDLPNLTVIGALNINDAN
ncbi:MAG: hypothetical protein J2P13_08895 [Acidobacteria bacterium]|nr:hypothetical protein [Acidobacteriota bacterium]